MGFQVTPSALVQRSPLSVVISKTGVGGLGAAGFAFVFFETEISLAETSAVAVSMGDPLVTVTVWVAAPTASERFATAG